MSSKLMKWTAVKNAVITLASVVACASPAAAADAAVPAAIEKNVREAVAQLVAVCPLADAGDQRAFDRCRQNLFSESKLQKMMNPITLWGRQTDATKPLRDTNLTQFAPESLTGLYVPLFMFDGSYKISYDEREKLYVAKLGVAFRNRLQPGQFPYPFWHESDKWNTYENARAMLWWIDPQSAKVRVAQFSKHGDGPQAPPFIRAQLPQFDDAWLWTDKEGKTQPAVTLFDGLFKHDNPYKEQLSASYRDFAISLRDGQCMSCHVPNNPNHMKRLVLLQSPAMAAQEIKRVLKQVRNDTMPIDEFSIEKPLDAAMKKTLLEKGGEFERIVDLARAWEKSRAQADAQKAPAGAAQTQAVNQTSW